MGLFANAAKQIKKDTEGNFKPLELDEMNVQAIFNRCLAKSDSQKEDIDNSILFSRILGYRPSDELVIHFDKRKLLDNKKNIEYLYGQLKNSHERVDTMSIEDAFHNYLGINWTNNKAHLLEFLHLGCTNEINFVSPFNAKNNSADLIIDSIKPTLSPKDPNFPAWWEEHKSEWEEPKKDGQEPADD